MAIKLTDIVTVMKDKWTYGDKFFGYTEEFNDNHKTFYPSLLITPPDSVFPEVGLDNGWENYTFEVYFSDLYNRTAQANESIEQRWENLQDLGTEWLDNFLKYYQAEAPITGFLEDESVSIERNKEVANDQLVQIKMTFTWRVLSKCFRPQSTYPNQISGLTSWLRADSNVTFSIPTKKVSAIGDSSENSNGVSQADKDFQPIRHTYGGALDKTRISFDGVNDYLVSDNNCPITGNDLTMFYVGKSNATSAVSQRVIGYRDSAGGGTDRLNFGIQNTGRVWFKVIDDSNNGGSLISSISDLGTVNHIASARVEDTNFYLRYNNNTEVSGSFTFSNNNGFTLAPFTIGSVELGAVGTHWDGDIQEVIIYNRALSKFETDKVVDYLNKKYKIY
jgi:hypothetical protein